MIYTGKSFQRRPWEVYDHGLIRHYEDIEVRDLAPPAALKGFYLCPHSSKALLNEQKIACDLADGWFWPKLKLTNFRVLNCRNIVPLYITDGIIPGHKFEICMKKGHFQNIAGTGPMISLQYMNLGDVLLDGITHKDVETPIVEIRNCTISTLKIHQSDNLKFDIQNSFIRRVELYLSSGITFGPTAPQDIMELPSSAEGVVGSVSVIVAIGDKLHRADAPNILFRDYR